MFEVAIHLWLQRCDAVWFLKLMTAISWLGRGEVYMPVMLALLFGVRLRPALGVLLALLLTHTITDGIKHGFGLPRPSEVDARVLDKGRSGRNLVANGAATTFWALPGDEAITAARERPKPDFGFVSGHTSAATVFVLSLALFFGARKKRWWFAVGLWPLVMGLSRLYLGRHFLADVIGGLLVGAAGALATHALLRRIPEHEARTHRDWVKPLALVVALSFLPWVNPSAAGTIAGTLICIGVLSWRGYPSDAAGPLHRGLRVALALLVGYGVMIAFTAVYRAGGWPERHLAAFLLATAGYTLALGGTILLARRLGLYR